MRWTRIHLTGLLICVVSTLLAGSATTAWGAIGATATITTAQTSAPYTYTISLHNTGTTNIGSFWFAWNPSGYNFLESAPLSVTPPSGWTDTVTNLYPGYDGYGIEFVDNGTLLPPGGTLNTFKFESNDSPASLSGDSVWYPNPKVATSYVYQGAPLGDPGAALVATVTTVPEPATIILAGISAVLFAGYRRR